ncbi:penicillin-binding protein 2 [Pseudooceanicola sp. CBS1P-1]|uniref:Penicillin-binding protein 2 n=1 Tax=Pseudooceanicola albus TaxID=2692189 RepID=A0A6L7G982_9RHOB|nr:MULTISPECIES: penicillin-binding protein 2 [Pseudooceanicola]MBT9383065.1 penicillin-binding protein 2 [Pseudooceanicola endophyticus]MXN19253.1 penicillin-binding protein 2 [Pseudooceanicola albus]
MTRTPLRPLAAILNARAKGENPDVIERENLRQRHEQMRDRSRLRAEGRLLILGLAFLCAFGTIGFRMGAMASSTPSEPRTSSGGVGLVASRADIVDRNGRVLATNMETYSLYAHPQQMVHPLQTAKALAKIFPDLNEERLIKDFTGSRKFVWLRRTMSPEQRQATHDIGEPGLLFGPREMRLYPNGPVASHILGGTKFEKEDVDWAEMTGSAGIEHRFDSMLNDPNNGGRPLQLSIDLTVQAALEQVLSGGMKLMNSKGAAAVLMKVKTGEIVAMASLPDYDPNDPPPPPTKGTPDDSPLFDRAVQGLYELGSVFKVFDISQAIDLGLVKPTTVIDITGPIRWGRFRISDDHYIGRSADVNTILEESSNIGAARIAQMIGAQRQEAFLRKLGLMDPSPIEMSEAEVTKPAHQTNWSELTTMTVSYGHGITVSPVMLAAAYATIANDGRKVTPTLLRHPQPSVGPQIIKPETAEIMHKMLRSVVTDGTASLGDVPGYEIGGKTGTADKVKPTGGYYKDRTIATFASMFPTSDPQYVLITMLDEPETSIASIKHPLRTAGWTSVPVAKEIIRRIGPLLGLRPRVEPTPVAAITQ